MTHIEYLEKLVEQYKEEYEDLEALNYFNTHEEDYHYYRGAINTLLRVIEDLKNGGDFE